MEDQLSTNHSVLNVQPIAWLDQDQAVREVQPCTESAVGNAENRAEQIWHDENGNFAKGNPGGPGRPPTAVISEAYKAILKRDGAEKYAAIVAKDALEATRARDRLAAIGEMTDRTEGKATQRIDARGVFVVMAPEAGSLAALEAWADE